MFDEMYWPDWVVCICLGVTTSIETNINNWRTLLCGSQMSSDCVLLFSWVIVSYLCLCSNIQHFCGYIKQLPSLEDKAVKIKRYNHTKKARDISEDTYVYIHHSLVSGIILVCKIVNFHEKSGLRLSKKKKSVRTYIKKDSPSPPPKKRKKEKECCRHCKLVLFEKLQK